MRQKGDEEEMNNDVITMTKNKETGAWELTAPESASVATLEQEDKSKANMKQGLGGAIDKMEFQGIKWGAGVAGGTVALVTTELVDGIVKLEGITGSLAKLVAAAVLLRFGSGFLGRTTTTYAGAFIAFDVARRLIPIDEGISNLMGRFGGSQSRNRTVTRQIPRNDVVAQATQVAGDYYAKAFGG